MESVLAQHDFIYGGQGQGPPIFPHENNGSDFDLTMQRRGCLAAGPVALKRRRQRYLKNKKMKKQQMKQRQQAALLANNAAGSHHHHRHKTPPSTTITSNNAMTPTTTTTTTGPPRPCIIGTSTSTSTRSCSNLPASDLPSGFPPQLAYRALAVYSFIRTTSRELRLSPFTPNVFLRALLLPVPNRLLGQVHVALLRVLLPGLHMGYHWGGGGGSGTGTGGAGGAGGGINSHKSSSSKHGGGGGGGGGIVPVQVTKKRKIDGLRWPLRGGDNLEYMDYYTWPIFFDDYAHLTADIIYASWHSVTTTTTSENDDDDEHDKNIAHHHHTVPMILDSPYLDFRSLDISHVPSDLLPIERLELQRQQEQNRANNNNKRKVLTKIGSTRRDTTTITNRNNSSMPTAPPPRTSIIYLNDDDEEEEANDNASTEDEFQLEEEDDDDDDDDDEEFELKSRRGRPPKKKQRRSGGGDQATKFSRNSTNNNNNNRTCASNFAAMPCNMNQISNNNSIMMLNPPPVHHHHPAALALSSQQVVPLVLAMGDLQRLQLARAQSRQTAAAILQQQHQQKSSSTLPGQVFPSATINSSPQQQQQRHYNNNLQQPTLNVLGLRAFKLSNATIATMQQTNSQQQQQHTNGQQHQQQPSLSQGTPQLNGAQAQQMVSVAPQRPPAPANCLQSPFVTQQQQQPPCLQQANYDHTQQQQQQLNTTCSHNSSSVLHLNQQQRQHQQQIMMNQSQPQQPHSVPAMTPDFQDAAAVAASLFGNEKTTTTLTSAAANNANNITNDQHVDVMVAQATLTTTNPQVARLDENCGGAQKEMPTSSMNTFVAAAPATMSSDLIHCPQVVLVATLENQQVATTTHVPATATTDMNPDPRVIASASLASTMISCEMADSTAATNHAEKVKSKAADIEEKTLAPKEQNLMDADTALEAFIWGRGNGHQSSSKKSEERPNDKQARSTNVLNDEPPRQQQATSRSADDIWTHFRALKVMRAGTPYHRLSIEKKLDILEFLIDDLLSVDIIADAMLRRSIAVVPPPTNECSYGPLPTDADIENMENEDYCAVCALEGDLLCCDGCTKSYHTKCLAIPRLLPDGEWYCPECLVVDPAKIGPVDKGCLSALDWFDASDLKKNSHGDENPPNVWDTMDSLASTGENEHDSGKPTTQYLAIHGFVFRRLAPSCRDQNPSWMSEPLLPMAGEELQSLLADLGLSKSRAWPLAQVPQESWLTTGSPLRAPPRRFLKSRESFDPTFYESRYRLAPLPLPFAKVQDAHLSNYDEACARVNFQGISCRLVARMDGDNELVDALQTDSRVFSPYQMIHDFMLNLETNIAKSFLFDPNWGTSSSSSTSGQMDVWRANVRSCRSIPRLCGFLLQFVDALHPRVFKEDWFNAPSVKSEDRSDEAGHRGMFKLASDSTPEGESRRRSWERCAAGNLERLLARETSNSGDWIQKLRPELAAISYTRKQRKKDRKGLSTEKPVESGDSEKGLRDEHQVGERMRDEHQVGEGMTNETSQDEHAKSRRRSDRTCSAGTADKSRIRGTENMASSIEHEQNARMAEIVKDLQFPQLENTFWPVCGRGFIDPPGRLPRKEVRRLGRCAGTVHAPFVQYPLLHEVGQFSYYHIWRKRVMHCDTLEEMLILNRMLSSFINTATVSSSKTIARRHSKQKKTAMSNVYCAQQDIKNGEKFYFILDKSGTWGRWVSWRDVDIETLSIYYATKRAERIRVFYNKINERKDARTITYWADAIKPPTPPPIPVQIPKPVKPKKAKVAKANVGQPNAKACKTAAKPRTGQPHAAKANSAKPPAVQASAVEAVASNPAGLTLPQFNHFAQPNHLAQLPQSQMSMLPQTLSFGTTNTIAIIGQELSRILENHTQDMTSLLQRFGGNVPDLHVQALRLTNILRAKNILSCVKIPFDDGLFSQNLANAEAKAIDANKKQGIACGQGSSSKHVPTPQQSSAGNTIHVSSVMSNNPVPSVNRRPSPSMQAQRPVPPTSSQIPSKRSNSNSAPRKNRQPRPAAQTITQNHDELHNSSLSPRPFSNEGSVLQQQQAPSVHTQICSTQQANRNDQPRATLPNAALVWGSQTYNQTAPHNQPGRKSDFSNLQALLSSQNQAGNTNDFSNLETLLQRVVAGSQPHAPAPSNGHGQQEVVHTKGYGDVVIVPGMQEVVHTKGYGDVVIVPGMQQAPVGKQSQSHNSNRKASKKRQGSSQSRRPAASSGQPPPYEALHGPPPVAMNMNGHVGFAARPYGGSTGGSQFQSEQPSGREGHHQFANPQNNSRVPSPYAATGGGPVQQQAREPTSSSCVQTQMANAQAYEHEWQVSNSYGGSSHNTEFPRGSTQVAQHDQHYQHMYNQQPALYGGSTRGSHVHPEQHWQQQQQQVPPPQVHQQLGHTNAPGFFVAPDPYHRAVVDSAFVPPAPHHPQSVNEPVSYLEIHDTSGQQWMNDHHAHAHAHAQGPPPPAVNYYGGGQSQPAAGPPAEAPGGYNEGFEANSLQDLMQLWRRS